MPRTVICDTSCLIILSKIEELELLAEVYGEVVTTPEVIEEYGKKKPSWVTVEAAENLERQKILKVPLDPGEASIIALALDAQQSLLILDKLKARRIANELRIKITGTLGAIHRA